MNVKKFEETALWDSFAISRIFIHLILWSKSKSQAHPEIDSRRIRA